MDHHGMLDLAPLYALDALEGSELADFESHLATCETCTAEVAVHQSVASSLTGDESAPSGLWDRIAEEISEAPPADVVPIDHRRRDRRMIWVAAVAAVVALLLGTVAVIQAMTVNELTGPDGVVAAAEAASQEPGAIVADLDSPDGTVAQIVLTADGEGFLIPANLETLGEDRTYQLWVLTPEEGAISAGVLGNDPSPARFTFTGDVAGFALTREVAGGVPSTAGDVVSAVEL